MNIEVPKRLDRRNINNFMDLVVDEDGKPRSQTMIFDFSELEFILPAGVTSLGNAFEWLIKRDVEVHIKNPESIGAKKHCPIKYLDDSDFFERYIGQKLRPNAQVRTTTMPLQRVAYDYSVGWLGSTFTPWMSRELSVQNDALANINLCLGEIFNNIRDHSKEKIGCIYAQHFPKRHELVFSISDFGVGIPYNIRKKKPGITDAEALVLAITEGYTTQTTPRNLGAGLHTLISNVVKDNNGSVYIHSGYGILEVTPEGGTRTRTSKGYYPGTFLDVNLDTKQIQNEDQINQEEEFAW